MASGEPPQLAGITMAHNAVRHDAQPKPSPALPDLTWSNTLAAAAQTWASTCTWGHTPNNPYGQNMYASGGSTPSAAAVMNSWASEADDYNYANGSCSDVCGHYTQVVWRNTTQVGCAINHCTSGAPWGSGAWDVVVCNYDPPGNFGNAKPY